MSAVRTWADIQGGAEAVEALSLRELVDLGVSRADLAALTSDARISERLSHAADAFGLSVAALEAAPGAYAESRVLCATCSGACTCNQSLDTGLPEQRAAAGVCPNAAGFDELSNPRD